MASFKQFMNLANYYNNPHIYSTLLSGLIYYTGLKDTNRSTFYWGNTMVHTDNNKYTNYVLMGRCGTSDIDAIRYNFNAGTFDMGIIKLFGLK